ncbi:MAG: hypothetical protein KY450_14340 [Actinobacteria bacterium]|nr:hypothetical protein [Actinomycetota bacterium]
MYVGRARPSGGDRLAPPLPGGGPAFPQSGEDRTEPGALELTLHPDVVTNIDDAAGRWQHERGRVSDHGSPLGIYASTSHLAAARGHPEATLTLTIFFLRSSPPETLTVHGARDAGSDSDAGTVSAASGRHADRVGSRFRRTGDIVTID